MSSELKNMSIFLTRPGMKTNKFPTFAEYKKGYRDKMYLHPDKAGKENEEAFKEITEAAYKIHAWITENPEMQKGKAEEYKRVAKCFDRINDVEYKTSSVVIYVSEEQCTAWMNALGKRYGASIPLVDQVGVQFKTNHLKIPKVTDTFGSFSASVWQHPGKGQPKLLLQGKAYMTFVTLVMPDILKEIEAKNDNQKALEESLAIDEIDQDGALSTDVPVHGAAGEADVQTLMLGFQKMESEVFKLRDNLVGIVDQSLHQIKENFNMERFDQKIDRLEKIVLHNKSELANLNNKVDVVIMHQQKVNPIDSDALGEFLTNSQTIFTKLDNITSIHMDAGDVAAVLETVKKGQVDEALMQAFLSDSKNISEKLNEVNKVTKDIKDDLAKFETKTESKELKTVVESAEKMMPVLDTISRICTVKTFHIEKHDNARDPELYLNKNLSILDKSSDIDFVILSMGTNDITKLNI